MWGDAPLHGLLVMHALGRISGHMALLDREIRLVFTSDSVFKDRGELRAIPGRY